LRGKPWEYLFYVDFLGREDEERAQNALNHLRELADFLRVLGSYPRGE
jgi:prephenate dehydratase